MTEDEREAREERSRARVATWPLPSPEQLTRLRHLLDHPAELHEPQGGAEEA